MTAPANVRTPPGTETAPVPATTSTAAAPVKIKVRKVDPTYYWMIIPVLILFAMFSTVPALIGGFFSFTNYAGYGDWKMVGCGISRTSSPIRKSWPPTPSPSSLPSWQPLR